MYNNAWTVEQTKRLFELSDQMTKAGKGLSAAFEIIAAETGRQPGSVRNYYYSHMHTLGLMPELSEKYGIKIRKAQAKPFKVFASGEAEEIVAKILVMMAAGASVRSATNELSKGDAKLALRLQNKYRSIVCRQRTRAKAVMDQLRREGKAYWNPYTKSVVENGSDEKAGIRDTLELIEGAAQKTADPTVAAVLSALSGIIGQIDPATESQKDSRIAALESQKAVLEARLRRLGDTPDLVPATPEASKVPVSTRIGEFGEYMKTLDAGKSRKTGKAK